MQCSKILYSKGLIKQKNMLTQSQSDIKFLAKLDNVKTFYNSLKAINFNQDVTITLSEDGFKAVVEESKYVQASMYITRSYFSEFHLWENEPLSMRVNLTVVTDCLSIFASPECSVKILYKGSGAPLIMILEQHDENDLITEVAIKTKVGEDLLDFSVDEDDASYTSIIVRGAEFSTLLNEINKSAVNELELSFSPNVPYFKIKLNGTNDESIISIDKSSEMFISYYCKTELVANYKLSHMRLVMRALALATKVAIRSDKTGLFSLQIMVHSDGDSQIYIEYFLAPAMDQ